tara:strand:+ start:2162 stop:2419 length:258 start_codon:yes stop_codon:yes gene_type:complete
LPRLKSRNNKFILPPPPTPKRWGIKIFTGKKKTDNIQHNDINPVYSKDFSINIRKHLKSSFNRIGALSSLPATLLHNCLKAAKEQ